ncbi:MULTISPECIES: rod shape-determining protein MreD [Virgibacillus]|uniref:Rod shape-determining protein MreD n=1 Tax=Virgibacillus dokdonensis TaxID=302167 RepID=A0A2K9J705_9BACI|nr:MULTISPECIES: rod shape-determining protein MreD [Virgibacillus]AUJ26131.1 Rod shape-determining protein MreD [Virgibacillus dokdonensis]NWO13308.1 rod shape-determining protein MreD [Virgibacillus sp.]
MKRAYLPLILLLILVLQGVSLELLPGNLLKSDWLIVSHWVFIFLVFIAVFYDNESTHYSVLYALIFGLLIDIVYTSTLGVYMFSYASTIYLIYGLKKLLHGNILVVALLGIVGLVVSDGMIYLIYSVVALTDMPWSMYLTNRLLPTIGSNLIFLFVLYPLFAKKLTNWGKDQITKGNSF